VVAAELAWSPQSREDLLEIYVIIGLDNPAAAERVYTAIEAKAEALAHFPRLGPRRPDIARVRASSSKGRISFSSKRTPTPTRVRSTGSRSSASSTVGVTNLF
jgi:plasmid stabilization system protein ParE